MKRSNPSQETTFGYLSALETPEYGFFGGYLVISHLGRPLEFHCTAPVRPSRAQEILYGPTLQPYLLGEQIGGTLLKKAEVTPRIVLTDQAAVLSLRPLAKSPLVQLTDWPRDEAGHSVQAEGAAASTGLSSTSFSLLGCEWNLPLGYEAEHSAVVELLNLLAKQVDVWEPFDRIHEAIREAQRIGSQGPDANAHAA